MQGTKKKLISGRFAAGLGIYALVLAVLLAAGLVFFWVFIRSYEQTRPATAVKAYLAGLDADYLREHAQPFFSSLDSSVQSGEESLERICELIEGADYVRAPGENNGSYTYVLRSGDVNFASVTFTAGERNLFGFPSWELSQEDFAFENFCQQTELVVPAGYTVILNGIRLGAGQIDDDRVPYSLLAEFYDDGYDLPYLTRYRTGSYVGELPLEVLDETGRDVAPEDLTEELFTDNCTDEEKAAVYDFAQEYFTNYVGYMGSHEEGGIYMYYMLLYRMVMPDSDLLSRLTQVSGLGFSYSIDSLQSVTLNNVMNVGNGCYVCALTYVVQTLGHADYVTTTNNTKLVLFDTEYGLKASSQAIY